MVERAPGVPGGPDNGESPFVFKLTACLQANHRGPISSAAARLYVGGARCLRSSQVTTDRSHRLRRLRPILLGT